MKLMMMRALWGVVHTFDGPRTFSNALRAIAALGYDGIEVPYKFALHVRHSERERDCHTHRE
jgi:sugar phosphate isomerase/epimerase